MKRSRKILGISFDDIWFDKKSFFESKKAFVVLHTNEQLENIKALVIVGHTFIINLGSNLDELFQGFDKKSCRHEIKKAQERGIVAKKADSQKEILQFRDFLDEFAKEKGFSCPDTEELKQYDIFSAFSSKGEYLGGCAFIKSKDKTYYRYKHGATNHYHRGVNDLIIWEAIKYAKSKGFCFFDMGGVTVTDNKNSYNYSHFSFKKKFGGELVSTYTYIKGNYFLFKFAYLCVKPFIKDNNRLVNTLSKLKILK